MKYCVACTSSSRCTRCGSSKYLDTALKGCISNCLSEDSARPAVWHDASNSNDRRCRRCDATVKYCIKCNSAK